MTHSWNRGLRSSLEGVGDRLLTNEFNLPIALHVVEGDRYPRGLAMKHSKLTAIGFPGKGYDGFYNQQEKRSQPLSSHQHIHFHFQRSSLSWRKAPKS